MVEVTQADREAANEAQRNAIMRVGSMHEAFAIHRIEAAKAERDRLQQKIEALEAALRRMIYETTHLSPMKPNGDHDCTIKADALEQARQALESQP